MKRDEIAYKIWTHPILVFSILLILLLVSNGTTPLIDQDEGAYAVIAAKMANTGLFIDQPTFWTYMHRKPPLHFWCIAHSLKWLGNEVFMVRLSTALFSWGTLLLIYLYGKKIFHERIAISAAIICGTCFIFLVYGKIAFTDGTLLFFQTWAGFSLISILQYQGRIHYFFFWLAVSLGLLVKGPPILIFTGIFAVLSLILHPNRRKILSLHPYFFLPIALLPLLYWGYLYWQKDNGQTMSWMIDWYILKRGKGESVIENQTGLPGYYLLIFLVSFLPYFRYFILGLRRGLKSLFLDRKNPELLLTSIWMVSGWVIYEFIPSKLPSYALASLPAFSLLMAQQMVGISNKRLFDKRILFLSFVESLLLSVLPFVLYFLGVAYQVEKTLLYGLVAIFLILPIISWTTLALQWKRHYKIPVYIHLSGCLFFCLLLFGWAYPKAGKYWNGSEQLSVHISELPPSYSKIHIGHIQGQPPSILYYIQQKNRQYEMAKDFDFIREELLKETPTAVVISSDMFKQLQSEISLKHYVEVPTHRLDRGEYKESYYLVWN